MADISKEIRNFQEAEYGEEVRESMISLAEKVNADGEKVLEDVSKQIQLVNAEIKKAEAAIDDTEAATLRAEAAAANADNVKNSTEALRQDLQSKLEADYWRGKTGETGKQGEQGISGVQAPSAGMFSLELNPATGDLYAVYPDGSAPPKFEYDAAAGNLYYVIEEDGA